MKNEKLKAMVEETKKEYFDKLLESINYLKKDFTRDDVLNYKDIMTKLASDYNDLLTTIIYSIK